MNRVEKSPNGCWHWTGPTDAFGYGHYSYRRDGRYTSTTAHRYVFEWIHGPLPRRGEPDYGQLDHECHNRTRSCRGGSSCSHRRCVNPEHLAVKTPKANTLASPYTPASINRAKMRCLRGHELSGDNLGRYAGKRYCKTCHLARVNEARRERLRLERGEDWVPHNHNREKTHCKHGHPYSGDNLRIAPNGQRQCRACLRKAQARLRARKKAAR
jgi:hypothetical protein